MHKPGAAHSGGSCQVGFSYDKGETWVAVQNWEGNCPRVATPGEVTNVYDTNQNYTFTIPDDFPSGQRVIFAWYAAVTLNEEAYADVICRTWINASGNREFYMSCSSVTIKGRGSACNVTPKGPPLLIANLNPIQHDCYTNDATSILYPSKYNPLAATERAPIALKLQAFPVKNPDGCGSDNITILGILKKPVGWSAIGGQGTGKPKSIVSLAQTSVQIVRNTASAVSCLCNTLSEVARVPRPPLPGASPDPLWAVPEGD